MAFHHRVAVVAVLVGCGNVKNDPPGDGPGGVDDNPATTISVSPTGDDANDGLNAPVKTLKRALGIAATNTVINTVALASGRYEGATGETFPYTVPPNLVIHGPAGGGAVLVGTAAVPGLVVDAGELRDLELETFMVAITSRGATTLTNVRVREAGTALVAEATAKLVVAGLDITGLAGACAPGIELNGTADLKGSGVATRTLGVALEARDQSTVDLAANITGDATCLRQSGSTVGNQIVASTNKTFVLHDTIIDGGQDGINFSGTAGATQATLTNTIIRNLADDALLARSVVFQMTGGALVDNGRAGLETAFGDWTFTNVEIKNHPVMGIYFQDNSSTPVSLKLRGCTITGNRDGIYLFVSPIVDFGTAQSPGNNIIQNNSGLGINIDGSSTNGRLVPAIGNTWRPNVQGADANGKYTTAATISGPLEPGAGGNFAINDGWSISR